jgi:hypothetical protein
VGAALLPADAPGFGRARVAQLVQRISELQCEVNVLRRQVAALDQRNLWLSQRIVELEHRSNEC